MPLASLTRRLLRPRMDGLIGRAPSSGITTAQLAEAAPAHLICRTRRSENRELDLYTPKSAREKSELERALYRFRANDQLAEVASLQHSDESAWRVFCSADESPRRTFDGTPDARRAAGHVRLSRKRYSRFNMGGEIPEISGDYFEGGFLRFVSVPEHPFLARAQNLVVSSPRLFRPS